MKRFEWEHIWPGNEKEVLAIYADPDFQPLEMEDARRIVSGKDVKLEISTLLTVSVRIEVQVAVRDHTTEQVQQAVLVLP